MSFGLDWLLARERENTISSCSSNISETESQVPVVKWVSSFSSWESPPRETRSIDVIPAQNLPVGCPVGIQESVAVGLANLLFPSECYDTTCDLINVRVSISTWCKM